MVIVAPDDNADGTIGQILMIAIVVKKVFEVI